MDHDKDKPFWGDCVSKYISIFELKFKGNYASASDDIYKDYQKIKHYIKDLDLGADCRYYIASIWECQTTSKQWLEKDTAWAKGKLTELNADYNSKNQMCFYTKEHK